MAPSHFYSPSESDALAWLSKHTPSPRGVKSQHVFGNEDDFFLGLQARSDSSASGGRSLEQPLFKRSAPLAASQQLRWDKEESASETAAPSHTTSVHEDDMGDDLPQLALADLSYQFGVWSHNRRESVTAIPFAVLRAPQQAHAAFDKTPAPQQQQDTSTAALTLPQQEDDNSRSSGRAALIAKAKSAPSSSSGGVLTSKSSTQKRAALQKNRHRKPTVDMPAPTTQAEKPEAKSSIPTVLCYENTPEGHRTAVTLAIQQGLIDADDDAAIEALMKTIRESHNTKLKDDTDELDKHMTSGGVALGLINEDSTGESAGSSGTGVKMQSDATKAQDDGDDKQQRSKVKSKRKTKKTDSNRGRAI
jgi:hypothetical protein